MQPKYSYVSILGLVWGVNLVVSRFGVGQFHPVVFVGLRLGLAALGFSLIFLFSSNLTWPTDRSLWRHATVLGIFGTALPMTATISSLRYQSAGVTSLLVTISPAFIVVLAHFWLPDERLNRGKGIGVLLAIGGVLLIVLRGESGLPDASKASPLGYGLVLLAMIAESVMAIYIRRNMRGYDPMSVTGIRLWVATLVVLPLSFWLIRPDFSAVNGAGVWSLLFAAFGGALVGQLMAFFVTRRYGVTTFSLTGYIVPAVAAVTGILFLHEQFTLGLLAGMVLIALGILFINRAKAPQLQLQT